LVLNVWLGADSQEIHCWCQQEVCSVNGLKNLNAVRAHFFKISGPLILADYLSVKFSGPLILADFPSHIISGLLILADFPSCKISGPLILADFPSYKISGR
jgi:hypothetical protein